jgi:hypothetical protein
VFVTTTVVVLSGTEVIVDDAAVVEVLALRVHALAGEGFLVLAAALLRFLSLVQSAAA